MRPIACVGGGNMARAIIHGATDAGLLGPDAGRTVLVADPSPEARAAYGDAVPTAAEALRWLEQTERTPGEGTIVLAVKPQLLSQVGDELRALFDAGQSRVVISVLAGARSETVRAALGANARVVRTMPNLGASMRMSMTAVARGSGSVEGDESFPIELFGGIGRVITIDESLMDAFTGVAGSGPAYVFYLAEAMADAGRALGMSAEDAELAARQTILGAASVLGADDRPFAQLRAAVTSKNGTTDAGIRSLESDGVRDAVARAVQAARDRGAELADETAGR